MSVRVAFPFVGDTIGGSHVSAALLMTHLPEREFSPVAVVHGEGPLVPWLQARGLPTILADLPFLPSGTGGLAGAARLTSVAARLGKFLRANEFGLVHANDGRAITNWVPAARLFGVKAVAHRRTRWSASRMAELTLGMAHSIIAISAYVRDSLPDRLKKRASVILNPFDFQVPSRAAGRNAVEALIGEGQSVIGFVGTLQKQKRPDVFLRAAAKIHRRRPDTKFLVIGRDGGLEPEMRRLCAEIGLADAVVLTGFRADAQLLLAGCDLLIAPAVDEGYGRSLVEAMMCNVPVISSRSGGHIEILGSDERGLLVSADNPKAFAAAALSVLDQPAAAQVLAKAGYEWARLTFSPETHAEAIAAHYRFVLSI